MKEIDGRMELTDKVDPYGGPSKTGAAIGDTTTKTQQPGYTVDMTLCFVPPLMPKSGDGAPNLGERSKKGY